MKSEFKFDKATGTMVPVSDALAQGIKAGVRNDVTETKEVKSVEMPVFKEGNSVPVKASSPGMQRNQVVRMARVDKPTAMMLVDEKGMAESYLDSVSTGVMMFRELEDYDRCQITDDKTGKVLAIIAGYALQINFNMAELNTMERIEQCLQGLVKLFRHKIMTQPIDTGKAVSE